MNYYIIDRNGNRSKNTIAQSQKDAMEQNPAYRNVNFEPASKASKPTGAKTADNLGENSKKVEDQGSAAKNKKLNKN